MKKIHSIDFEKAAEGESFGALAIGRLGRKKSNKPATCDWIMAGPGTAAPAALATLLEWLLSVAKEAHADRSPLRARRFSVKLRHQGNKEILSVLKE